jgi:UDPglucose--hexose-1-phosphate uridylyltransferase
MELQREVLRSEILDPRRGFEPTPAEVEVRWDPLLGYTARLVRDARFLVPSDFDLEAYGRQTAKTCFFCTPRIEAVTPRFPAEVVPEGRLRRGEALLFPNIQAYSQYSSVSVYSPALHYLPLERFTGPVVRDNLAIQVEFLRRVAGHDPNAIWTAINGNHMLPSGSSLFHPHLQGSADPHPTIVQRLLSEVPGDLVRDYLDTERRLGVRHLGTLGGVEWLASFAPFGFNELRAFVSGVASPGELDEERIGALGEGLARALNLYAELGLESFNVAIYGAPPGADTALGLRLVSRSNLDTLYRSDVAYFERMHWQAMVDRTPEELAERAGDRFRA